MTPVQTLDIKRSELRTRLLEADAEAADTLAAELAAVETEYRAAVIAADAEAAELADAEPEPDRVELRSAANVGEAVGDISAGRAPTGAVAELQSELGLASDQVPTELIVECRATADVPDDIQQSTPQGLGQIFAMSATNFLGVMPTTTGPGQRTVPVLTSTTAASNPAEAAQVAESDLVFEAVEQLPSRISARARFSIEDAARFGQLDSMVRQNLSAALMAGLDQRVVTAALGANTAPTAGQSAAVTWATYLAAVVSSDTIDGYRSGGPGDLRVLVNPEAMAVAATTIRGGNAADVTVYDLFMRLLGGFRASSHLPAAHTVASETNQADVLIRVGRMPDLSTVNWPGVSIIVDRYTRSDYGEIVLQTDMLNSTKILRAGGFKRSLIKLS